MGARPAEEHHCPAQHVKSKGSVKRGQENTEIEGPLFGSAHCATKPPRPIFNSCRDELLPLCTLCNHVVHAAGEGILKSFGPQGGSEIMLHTPARVAKIPRQKMMISTCVCEGGR